MKVFVSTSCVRRNTWTLEGLIDEYIDACLNQIELGFCGSIESSDLAAHLETYKAEFLVHNYFPKPPVPFVLNLATQDIDLLRRSMSLCKRAIDLSSRLRAPFYSVHAGFRADLKPSSLGRPAKFERIYPYDEAYLTFIESIQELTAYARVRGVLILVEPNVVPRFNLVKNRNELALICEAWEVLNLIRDAKSDRLGILLDTGHLNVTAETLDFDRMDFVEQVAPYIRAFHVHDNDGEVDMHLPIQSGSWVLDVLRHQEFSNLPIIIEANFHNVHDLRQHVNWLKKELMIE